jgi:hypothetical protein
LDRLSPPPRPFPLRLCPLWVVVVVVGAAEV